MFEIESKELADKLIQWSMSKLTVQPLQSALNQFICQSFDSISNHFNTLL